MKSLCTVGAINPLRWGFGCTVPHLVMMQVSVWLRATTLRVRASNLHEAVFSDISRRLYSVQAIAG